MHEDSCAPIIGDGRIFFWGGGWGAGGDWRWGWSQIRHYGPPSTSNVVLDSYNILFIIISNLGCEDYVLGKLNSPPPPTCLKVIMPLPEDLGCESTYWKSCF